MTNLQQQVNYCLRSAPVSAALLKYSALCAHKKVGMQKNEGVL